MNFCIIWCQHFRVMINYDWRLDDWSVTNLEYEFQEYVSELYWDHDLHHERESCSEIKMARNMRDVLWYLIIQGDIWAEMLCAGNPTQRDHWLSTSASGTTVTVVLLRLSGAPPSQCTPSTGAYTWAASWRYCGAPAMGDRSYDHLWPVQQLWFALPDHPQPDCWRDLLRDVWHDSRHGPVQPLVRGPQLHQESVRLGILHVILLGPTSVDQTEPRHWTQRKQC